LWRGGGPLQAGAEQNAPWPHHSIVWWSSAPAPACIVQHIGSNPSLLPELLRYRGNNHALHARLQDLAQQVPSGIEADAPA
jgi:hypothetical protein